jgi:MarR family transcriptional regulator, organic hydroperoxide resistance regulator
MSQEAEVSVIWPRKVKGGVFPRLRAASKAIQRELAFQLSEHGVAEPHYAYLRALLGKDGMTISEISERVGIEPATVTGMVDRLTSLGYVERVRHPSDRRKIQVFLTKKGELLREPLIAAMLATRDVTMAGVSETEHEIFFRTLDAIIRNVDEHLSENPHSSLRSDVTA